MRQAPLWDQLSPVTGPVDSFHRALDVQEDSISRRSRWQGCAGRARGQRRHLRYPLPPHCQVRESLCCAENTGTLASLRGPLSKPWGTRAQHHCDPDPWKPVPQPLGATAAWHWQALCRWAWSHVQGPWGRMDGADTPGVLPPSPSSAPPASCCLCVQSAVRVPVRRRPDPVSVVKQCLLFGSARSR